MALVQVLTATVIGVEGHLIDVQADLSIGEPSVGFIGLPDAVLLETRDRIRAAVVNSGEHWPNQRITLGLLPATLPTPGSLGDLAMAVAVLAAAGAVPAEALARRLLIGELALDGSVRPVRGVLPAVLAARERGLSRVVVPAANATEAALVPGVDVDPVADLAALLRLLRGEPSAARPIPPEMERPEPGDLADVAGQPRGRLAVEVAAAGGHHLALAGPPRSGRTMLAQRLPGLLPRLDSQAALEVTAIHSVAGVLPAGSPLVAWPPYQAPHHSSTPAALLGAAVGGMVRPGLASQAHRGVLYLEHAEEFTRPVLDALRHPLDTGQIEIVGAGATVRFPARFQLVLSSQPRAGHGGDRPAPRQHRRAGLHPFTGLLDRIDIQVELTAPSVAAIRADAAEGRGHAAARVAAARAAMTARLATTPWRVNAEVPAAALRQTWPLPATARRPLEQAVELGALTTRGAEQVLRVAWTLADLTGAARPGRDQVETALGLRIPDRDV